MRITALNEKIYLLSAPTQYEVAAAFMRFQEFYESPYKEIRGKYFTHEQYMDAYAQEMGNFTYTSDWLGFNIPSHIYSKAVQTLNHKQIRSFLCRTSDPGELWVKEKELVRLVAETRKENGSPKKYYIIGACETDSAIQTSKHEIAHALWYLYPEYKRVQKENSDCLPAKSEDKIKAMLLKRGYGKNVIQDELQAYLSTSTPHFLEKKMEFPKIAKKCSNRFAGAFESYYEVLGLHHKIKEWQKET